MSNEFLTVKLSGKRFNSHILPMDILSDFKILENMIVAQAKAHYFETHPDRKRLPKGFINNITMGLSNIEKGSVVCDVEIAYDAQSTYVLEVEEYYRHSVNNIIRIIKMGENDDLNDLNLSDQKILKNFDKFGCNLKDDESMSFISANNDAAILTKSSRQKMILASKNVEYNEILEDYGIISAVDIKTSIFKISFFDNEDRRIDAPLSDEYSKAVGDAIFDSEKGHIVWVKGTGLFDRNGKLVKLESIDELVLLDSLDIQARLHELSFLKDGWYDGIGLAPSSTSLKELSSMFSEHYPENAPLPRIYPTPEGNVSVEWTIGNWEISLEIELCNLVGTFLAIDVLTNKELEKEINLKEPAAWKDLTNFITNLNEGVNE